MQWRIQDQKPSGSLFKIQPKYRIHNKQKYTNIVLAGRFKNKKRIDSKIKIANFLQMNPARPNSLKSCEIECSAACRRRRPTDGGLEAV